MTKLDADWNYELAQDPGLAMGRLHTRMDEEMEIEFKDAQTAHAWVVRFGRAKKRVIKETEEKKAEEKDPNRLTFWDEALDFYEKMGTSRRANIVTVQHYGKCTPIVEVRFVNRNEKVEYD